MKTVTGIISTLVFAGSLTGMKAQSLQMERIAPLRNPDRGYHLESNFFVHDYRNPFHDGLVFPDSFIDDRAALFGAQDDSLTLTQLYLYLSDYVDGDIPEEAFDRMQAIFDGYDFGIEVVTVKLQNIVPPEGAVQDAFEDVNKAIQDMNKSINEGKEYYNTAIPEAQGEANRIVLQAEGYAAQRVNQAIGDVAAFDAMKASYEQAPEVTWTRLYLETMTDVLAPENGQVTLVDSSLENFLPVKNIGGGV